MSVCVTACQFVDLYECDLCTGVEFNSMLNGMSPGLHSRDHDMLSVILMS